MRPSLAILALAVCAGGAARAADTEPRLDRYDWSASPELSQAIGRVVVRNDYGDVRARAAGDNPAGVHAVIQRLGSGPQLGVNVERQGDTLAISVVAPPGRVAVDREEWPKTSIDRVDLVVFVPAQARLDAESLRGLVEARGLKSDVRAIARDGDVRVQTAGAVEARTHAGSLTVSLGAKPGRPSWLESESGAIWLGLASGGDFSLRVEAAGQVQSELKLKRARGAGPAPAQATLGKGTHPVAVRSRSGAVQVVLQR